MLLAGGVAVAMVVTAVALAAAWWRERPAPDRHAKARSWAARRAGDLGAPAPAVAGLGMAFDRGQGRASAAARSAVIGCAVGVAGVIGVVAFATALSNLFDTPRLYGWGNIDGADLTPEVVPAARKDPGVEAIGDVRIQMKLRVEGAPVYGMAIAKIDGDVEPSMASGRAPRTAHEVALGRDTLDTVGRKVGDTVRVEGPNDGSAVDLRIVGVAVFPATDDGFPIADGALVTPERAHALGEESSFHMIVVELRDGAGRAETIRRLEKANGRPFALPEAPAEVGKLRQVDRLPRALAILLAVLAAVATAHALALGVRRRGRDLAVLRVLGFRPRQVGSAVAWQATAIVLAGAFVGIPLGLLLGRVAWAMTARAVGVLAVDPLPVATLILIVPISVAGAVALAVLPARRAARLRPAAILRSE
jgi:ABC-type lipoprotein release transport system permease subunit